MKAVEIAGRCVLPATIAGVTLFAIPGMIVLFSVINPNLLYPSVEAIQPWQWEAAGIINALAVALFFISERGN